MAKPEGRVMVSVNAVSLSDSQSALISYWRGLDGSYDGAFGPLTSARRHFIPANFPLESENSELRNLSAFTGYPSPPSYSIVG